MVGRRRIEARVSGGIRDDNDPFGGMGGSGFGRLVAQAFTENKRLVGIKIEVQSGLSWRTGGGGKYFDTT